MTRLRVEEPAIELTGLAEIAAPVLLHRLRENVRHDKTPW
jgi:hypothetical protein